MYVYLVNNVAYELIPEINPTFPNIPIEDRYSAEFLSHCVQTDEEVQQGYIYEGEHFHPAEVPDPEPDPDDPDAEISAEEALDIILGGQ